MRIKRYETKAFVLSDEAILEIEQYFKTQAQEIGKKNNKQIQIKIQKGYKPILVYGALKKRDDSDKTGDQNFFHIDLTDGSVLNFHDKKGKERLLSAIEADRTPKIEKIDYLMQISDLSPKALSVIGYLMEHGTIKLEDLDMPTKKAVKELEGRKLAIIQNPKQLESSWSHAVREVFEMELINPVDFVKPVINMPFFTSGNYNLSRKLKIVDVVEEEYRLDKIAQSPEKLGLLLSTLFTCQVYEKVLVYLPYLECKYSWDGGQHIEIKYPACLKKIPSRQYENPIRLDIVNIGTKGHGLESTPIESKSINFTNVAGMDNLKEEIRSSIIYPLLNPEISEEYGKKAGGGVLFYGPPGCGKTYIVRATVGETGFNFFAASIQDIMGEDPQTASTQLHEIFNEARQAAPSVLFFDEIDALGGRREGKKGGAERMIINQFLTEMEGVGEGNKDMLIIGASNAPWDIDPALRRAGRFTNQIFVPPPERDAREALVKLHMKGRPIDEIDYDKLAEDTKEYASADITAICEEAAKIPWNETIHGGKKRGINMNDFAFVLSVRDPSITPWLRLAEKEMRKSGESDMYPGLAEYVYKRAGGIEAAEKPKINFTHVAGLEDVKEEIRSKVVFPLAKPELAKEYGRTVGGGIMLYGPPGCGKTYISRATAGECGASFYNVKLTDLLSPEEGVAEKQLHSIFERAARNTPSIIFFDEIDAVAGQRSSKKSGIERRLVNQFLTEMDGFEKKEGVMVIAATNTPWDIDPALRRAGRFSTQIYLPAPDKSGRKTAFELNCKNKPLEKNIDFNKLAERTTGFSYADITLVCQEAAKIPWAEAMSGKPKRNVSMQDFKTMIDSAEKTLAPWFNQAQRELDGSGETEGFVGLKNDIKKWNKKDIPTGPTENTVNQRKKRVAREMEILKNKLMSCEIEKGIYDEIMLDLTKKMVEIEAELD